MRPIELNNLAAKPEPPEPRPLPPAVTMRYCAFAIICLVVWFSAYKQLSSLADFIAFDLLTLSPDSRLGKAVQFFLYDTPKVLMLLVLVVFAVGILRSFFTPERTRKILAGKRESVGNVLAALLGIATPFCSCSAVPLFIGFVTAGIPLGVTFSFLIAAPMVNEVALVLLYGLLGWKVALLYLATGLAIAIVSGWIIGRLHMEKHVEEWVKNVLAGGNEKAMPANIHERMLYGWQAVKDIVGRVWPLVILGIGVGAGIHGYVPEGFMASIMGKSAWWSVPLAVVIGIPMYANAAGIVPILQALLAKGAALGTALAFMMSVIALSLPEMVILRKVLKPALIATFIGVVGSGILLVGFLFNLII
ncbi:MAG: permease [Proteobacteria bacterium]|nr:permease [Pseudomonadota bacterium]